MVVRRILALLSLVAVAAGACAQQGNVFELEAGTCFNGEIRGEVKSVPVVDCSLPHDNEVFALWNVTTPTLPDRAVLEQGCFERFQNRERAASAVPDVLFGSLLPSDEGFADGDREVVCIVVHREPQTGSLFVS